MARLERDPCAMTTPIRAWLYSVVTCVGVVAAVVAVLQLRTGRFEHALHNVADVTAGAAVAYALFAAFILVPVCFPIERTPRIAGTRRLFVLVCVVLAPATLLALRVALTESADPQAAGTWFRYWLHHPVELVLGGSPFLVPGAVFGASWRARTTRSRSGRG